VQACDFVLASVYLCSFSVNQVEVVIFTEVEI